MLRLAALFILLAGPALAQTVIAAHTIRARSQIGPQDVSTIAESLPGLFSDPADVIGQEARAVLYAGRPIQPGQIGPPALVERNQIVRLSYRDGDLLIRTKGRALARAGLGELVRVMNTSSHATVTGVVSAAGSVTVGGR